MHFYIEYKTAVEFNTHPIFLDVGFRKQFRKLNIPRI
jgi:hypothetical protein